MLKKEHDEMLEDLKDGYSILPDSVKKEILGDDHKLEELCADKPIKSPKSISIVCHKEPYPAQRRTVQAACLMNIRYYLMHYGICTNPQTTATFRPIFHP